MAGLHGPEIKDLLLIYLQAAFLNNAICMLVFLEEAPCVLWAFGKIIPYFITNNHWKLYSNGKYWSVVLYNFVFILWDLIYTFKVSCLLYVLFLFVSFLSLTMIFLSGEENLHNRSICKTVLLGESWSQKVPLEHVTESLPQPIFFFFFPWPSLTL